MTRVCRQVMRHGAADEVLSWLQLLEAESGVSPCWEILFESMCCPVPQRVKASMDKALAGLARQTSLVPLLWDRLLAAVVVRREAITEEGLKSVPVKYDLSYQLNEVEARAEEYEEAVAFVGLLNALWKGSASMPDGGAKLEHFTRFVVEQMLSSVYQRSFKSERERWELLGQCLLHCRLCLESLPSVMSDATRLPTSFPGRYVLMDLLEERTIFRVVFYTLSLGVDWLSGQFRDQSCPSEKSVAIAEALRLIRQAMSLDIEFISRIKAEWQGEAHSTLDAVILHDRTRALALMDYCRFSYEVQVRHEALRISQQLINRIPNIVNILESLHDDQGGLTSKKLRLGYNFCLQCVAVTPQATLEAEEQECAELCLEILLDSLTVESPNFAEYICGFDVAMGVDDMAVEDPKYSSTPLRVIMNIINNPAAASSRARLYEKCLQTLHAFAASPRTGMLHIISDTGQQGCDP